MTKKAGVVASDRVRQKLTPELSHTSGSMSRLLHERERSDKVTDPAQPGVVFQWGRVLSPICSVGCGEWFASRSSWSFSKQGRRSATASLLPLPFWSEIENEGVSREQKRVREGASVWKLSLFLARTYEAQYRGGTAPAIWTGSGFSDRAGFALIGKFVKMFRANFGPYEFFFGNDGHFCRQLLFTQGSY